MHQLQKIGIDSWCVGLGNDKNMTDRIIKVTLLTVAASDGGGSGSGDSKCSRRIRRPATLDSFILWSKTW